jgi:hypothetical protein
MTPVNLIGVVMNRNLITEPGSRTSCVQPGCLLKRKDFNAQHLAEFFIRILVGESMEFMAPESEPIIARPQCTHCALRVMQGRKAFLTETEWNHLDDLGHWHHRRQRRRERWRNLAH